MLRTYRTGKLDKKEYLRSLYGTVLKQIPYTERHQCRQHERTYKILNDLFFYAIFPHI